MGDRIKRRRIRLHQIDPRCHWCGRVTRLPKNNNDHSDDIATIDHLRSRLDPRRREPNPSKEERTVLACRRCNEQRAQAEVAALSKQELQERSKQHRLAIAHTGTVAQDEVRARRLSRRHKWAKL